MALSDALHTTPIQLDDIPYTQVWGGFRNSAEIITLMSPSLLSVQISVFEFEEFINLLIWEQNINDADIIAFKLTDNNCKIYLSTGRNVVFSLSDFHNHKISSILWAISLREAEDSVENINAAIESIFAENDGYIWDGEINGEDLVSSTDFGAELQWKNLKQLRELLEAENHKLLQVYNINWESDKKEELLKLELQFFVGIWDKYEWGSRYFALTSTEIGEKVRNLISHMTNEEVYAFIAETNASIEDNTKKSDMVNQINLKLTGELYRQIFERLLSTQAPDADFIGFAKVVTGRGRLISENAWDYEYGAS